MTIALNGPGYAPGRERSWHLSLWLSPELTGWCVHDLGDGRCVALHTAEGNALPDTAELPLRPASVSFVVMPEISTLVPETALAPGTETDHLRMVHGHLPTGLLRDEPITALDARCIYLHDEGQRATAEAVRAEADRALGGRVVTEIEPRHTYSRAEAYHQRYFAQHPNQGYCAMVVAPKVEKFRQVFANWQR